MMRTILTYGIFLLCLMISGSVAAPAQEADTVFISKLELLRSKKKVFDSRDSVLVLKIDTLIMEDRAALQFYGKKHVTMVIKHAEIGDRVNFTGRGGQNNASDMDIHIRFNQLGSLYIMADGQDANNGMRTHPNGDGGNVRLYFDPNGIRPQQEQSKEKHYLHINVSGGGQHANAAGDVRRILDRIRRTGNGVRGLPQGQIFSGTPGRDGEVAVLPQGGNLPQ